MLRFTCTGSRAEPYAAGPSLQLDLQVDEGSGRKVHAVALRCQIRIDPRKRHYSPAETARLGDIFGEPSRWGETLNLLQLATVSVMLSPFTCRTTVPVSVPLTYDLDIASTKYFHGLSDGEIPLLLLFSGTMFYAGDAGVQVGLVSWNEEAEHRLPVAVWRAAMDEHFPGSTWVRVRRETVDALAAYRSAHAIPTWDDTFSRLLKEAQG
ncbi:DUF6084 family protein [Pseudonocardia sp. H11422]|uniref:DUF6084 family protein n=1 Tax=Pseudonocardia sp. H11422 TaxID=2835866 RepID=UPI001BDC357F|nr:DUF6084 family protein [Pseudonocardia sp. H11422]